MPVTKQQAIEELRRRGIDPTPYMNQAQVGSGFISSQPNSAPDEIAKRQQYGVDYKSLSQASEAYASQQDALRRANTFLDLNKQSATGLGQNIWPAWDPRQQQMEGITSYLQGLARPKGSGATSDYEQRLYRQGVPSRTKSGEANQSIINYMNAVAHSEQDRLAFRQAYLNQNGTLSGADDAWTNYVSKNPYSKVSDKGIEYENPNRQDWRSYFGVQDGVKRNPRTVEVPVGVAIPRAQPPKKAQSSSSNSTVSNW